MGSLRKTIEVVLKRDPRKPLKNHLGFQYAKKSPADFLSYCAFVRALRQALPSLRKNSSVIVLSVSNGWPLKPYADYVEEILGFDDLGTTVRQPIGLYIHPTSREMKKKIADDELENRLACKHLIVLIEAGVSLLPDLQLVADQRIEVDVGRKRHLAALANLNGNGVVDDGTASLLRQQSQSTLSAIFRPGLSLEATIGRLQRPKRHSTYDRSTLTLSELPGFGDASVWAESLRRDIAEWRSGNLNWSEVDKGLLLQGPPGTGKTLFAEVLASTCHLTFIPSSLTQWQKMGHMGDLLKAMNQTFERAKEFAPSLLFLDEIDSIGDRETFTGDNAAYCTEVLSGLLELVDGSLGREGVIIAGACNYPEKIDKALVRSGRLEKHISFGLPDESGREEILRFYLPDLVATADLNDLSKRLTGWTAADLERLSRSARRTARTSNRPVSLDDVTSELPPTVPLTDATLKHIAVHEAGHAIVAMSLGVPVKRVAIRDRWDPVDREGVLGVTSVDQFPTGIKLKRDYLDEISVLLGGTAAEEMFFNERTSMAAVSAKGDLAEATRLAFEMIEHSGLGERLAVVPGQQLESVTQNPRLRAEIERVLQKQMDNVRSKIARWHSELFELSEELLHTKTVTGERAEEIFNGAEAMSNTLQ